MQFLVGAVEVVVIERETSEHRIDSQGLFEHQHGADPATEVVVAEGVVAVARAGGDGNGAPGGAAAKRGRCGAWEPCLSKGCMEVPFTCGTAWMYTRDGIRARAEPTG